MYILSTEKQGGGKLIVMPFGTVSICVALVLFSEACRSAANSQLHKWHMLELHITDECLEQFLFVFGPFLEC